MYVSLISVYAGHRTISFEVPRGASQNPARLWWWWWCPTDHYPSGGKEGPSEDAPVDGDFDISMYRSKAGWKIQSLSSSKNASSCDLLVPTRPGFCHRERLQRGVMTRGNDRGGDRDWLRSKTRWCGCEVNMTASRLAMKWLDDTHALLILLRRCRIWPIITKCDQKRKRVYTNNHLVLLQSTWETRSSTYVISNTWNYSMM